jgi:hypothetical protein
MKMEWAILLDGLPSNGVVTCVDFNFWVEGIDSYSDSSSTSGNRVGHSDFFLGIVRVVVAGGVVVMTVNKVAIRVQRNDRHK